MTDRYLIRLRSPRACDCGDHGFIPLQNWMTALISPEDVDKCRSFGWNAQNRIQNFYVRSSTKKARKYLHRYILCAKENQIVDHISRDTMDNRRENLRFVTPSESSYNTVNPNKCGYKGVTRYSHGYFSSYRKNRKAVHIGCYKTALEAAVAYDHIVSGLPEPRKTNLEIGRITGLQFLTVTPNRKGNRFRAG